VRSLNSVWMMTMGAPQCAQTKVERTMTLGASASSGSDVATGATCNSSRARAKFSLRPLLAISP